MNKGKSNSEYPTMLLLLRECQSELSIECNETVSDSTEWGVVSKYVEKREFAK